MNNNGKKVIEICQCHDIKIVNGRMGEDRYTSATTCSDASVIDYIICSPTFFPCIQNFRVDTFDPLLSDKYNPLIITIALKGHDSGSVNISSADVFNAQNKILKTRWNNNKKEDYLQTFDLQRIEDFHSKLFNLTDAT